MRNKTTVLFKGKFCCRSGSLGNRLRDGELPAGGLLGNDLGIDICAETKAADLGRGRSQAAVQSQQRSLLISQGALELGWPCREVPK